MSKQNSSRELCPVAAGVTSASSSSISIGGASVRDRPGDAGEGVVSKAVLSGPEA